MFINCLFIVKHKLFLYVCKGVYSTCISLVLSVVFFFNVVVVNVVVEVRQITQLEFFSEQLANHLSPVTQNIYKCIKQRLYKIKDSTRNYCRTFIHFKILNKKKQIFFFSSNVY